MNEDERSLGMMHPSQNLKVTVPYLLELAVLCRIDLERV
jgi:hypothetical protein